MDYEGALIEQYRTVRQEGLEAMSRHQTIAQYGLATAGVGVGIGLVAGATSAPAAAIVLMGLIPTTAIFGGAMMAAEAQRMARAGCFLRHLERLINESMPSTDSPFRWESDLAASDMRVRGYVLATAAVIMAALIIGPGLGGYFLLHAHLVIEFWLAVSADLFAIVALIWWAHEIVVVLRHWTTQPWTSPAYGGRSDQDSG